MEVAALTREHALADGRLTLLGAVDTVTGAMTRLEAGGSALLIDCGIAQGRDADAWRFPEAARDVSAVLLSHGHNDHVGSLPALLEGGFEGPIYGTAPTLDIAELLLADNIKLQGGSEGDVLRFRRRLRALAQRVGYDQSFVPRGFDGEASFREAGHILGSAPSSWHHVNRA